MTSRTLRAVASRDLSEARTLAAMADAEGWNSDADGYAVEFAQALASDGGNLDTQRERLAALASIATGLAADAASASEIGRHYVILEALFRRLLLDSCKASASGQRSGSEAAERLLNGALKAQRAALACLSALKMLREALPSPATTTTAAVLRAGRAAGGVAQIVEAN